MGTLLIVDDDRTNLEIYNQFLSGLDYHLFFAVSGEVAVEIAEKRQPDMIIMDWQMPDLDGVEAMKSMKDNVDIQHIPIVIATGVMLSPESLMAAFEAGAHGYIPKPFRQLDLLAVINATLNFSRTQQEIHKKNEALERLNKEKEHMLHVVAHDLQAPLNKLRSLIQLTQMHGELSEEQDAYMNMMPDIIDQGQNLIQDLLALHAYEHQGTRVKNETIALDSFIGNCIKGHQHAAAKKSIELKLSVPQKGLTCISDPRLLNRVIDNLLSNAIKFSFSGQQVEIGVRKVNECIHFSIKDSGPGLSIEDQKKLFQKFQRLSPQPTGGEHSTGLGLSIVKTLLEALKGHIKVKSELYHGSEFIAIVPVSSALT